MSVKRGSKRTHSLPGETSPSSLKPNSANGTDRPSQLTDTVTVESETVSDGPLTRISKRVRLAPPSTNSSDGRSSTVVTANDTEGSHTNSSMVDDAAAVTAVTPNQGSCPTPSFLSTLAACYPPPLVHVGDELDLDPDCPAQTFSEWREDPNRNEVAKKKRTIYLVAPPTIEDEASQVREWTKPTSAGTKVQMNRRTTTTEQDEDNEEKQESPNIDHITGYLRAVYLGLDVKVLPALRLTLWDDSKSKPRLNFIGLNTGAELVRIRTRVSLDGIYARQLNLNDLLDAAIGMVPTDAYALVFLTAHDLYETSDDVFTCGRAYGGDRVAVISIARYHPQLDHAQGIDRADVWPAAHFGALARNAIKIKQSGTKKKGSKKTVGQRGEDSIPTTDFTAPNLPLHAAYEAHRAVSTSARGASQSFAASSVVSSVTPSSAAAAASSSSSSVSPTLSPLSGLWLGRVCKTVSHELGHCFCLDHCVHYACIMQGSANLREDARQPPYLCQEEHQKLTAATGVNATQRENSISEFLARFPQIQLFAAYHAWLRKKHELLQSVQR